MTDHQTFPRGWFQFLWSTDLCPGELRIVHYFDADWIVWRDSHGIAHVCDAYCPHLGAHFGSGGAVTELGLQCGFHHWTFAPDGGVAHIPYGEFVPRGKPLKVLPVEEVNGHILVWFDPAGAPPAWEAPTVPQFGSDEFGGYHRQLSITVRGSCFQLAENLIDAAHIPIVHHLPPIEDLSVVAVGPFRRVTLTEAVRSPFGSVPMQTQADCFGLGYTVVTFTSTAFLISVSSAVPVDPSNVVVHFSWLARRRKSQVERRRVIDKVIEGMVSTFEEDRQIWEQRKHLKSPLLLPEEKLIREFRRWALQFF